MQKITKQCPYDMLFPVLDVNDECIISKSGDITFVYSLELPVKNTGTAAAYNELRHLFEKAYGLLPVDTIILKQDIFFKKIYEKKEKDSSFLIGRYWEHFSGREYLSHQAVLYFTLPHENRRNISSLSSILTKRHIVVGEATEKKIRSFQEQVYQAVSILSSDNLLLKIQKPTRSEVLELISHVQNFCYGPELLSKDYLVDAESMSIGSKDIYNLSLNTLEDMPNAIEENIVDKMLSTDSTALLSSPLAQAGAGIPVNHIVNQYIKIIRSDVEMTRLRRRSNWLRAFQRLSAQNTVNHQNIENYITDSTNDRTQTVKCSIQILLDGKEEINNIVSALLKQGMHMRLNSYNAPAVFWASLPGNAADLAKEEYMTMSLQSAVALSSLETSSREIMDGTFYITDRNTHVPICLDLSREALKSKLITNYNVFILGPSGTGKSFFTNEVVMQAYYRDQAHCVIIDQGDSYFSLCQLINEETEGKDGIYFNADDYPFSFNPFLNLETEEDKTFIRSLIYCLWNIKPTASQDTIINEALESYIKKGLKRGFDEFVHFLSGSYYKQHQEDFDGAHFDIANFKTAMRSFCKKGMYGKLLNNKSNIDLTETRFILFEIDRISNNKKLFPIITLLITKIFADKMRSAKDKKLMVIEEAWKAIASPEMEEWIQWLWKTARKHNAQAIVVTQEVQDLISSPIIKDTIISNSSIKVLLDQRSIKNKYDIVSSNLSLSEQDKNMIFSIGRNPDIRYNYAEVFIAIGDWKNVYALETSRSAYWTYTTTPNEKELRAAEFESCGSYINAIDNLSKK